jgi:hypothetical protein
MCAAVVSLLAVSVAMSEEFFASISKVEDGKVTFTKGFAFGKKKDDKKPEPMTLPLAKNAKFSKGGKFNFKDKSVEGGEEIKMDAVKELISKGGEKGTFAQIVTDKDNKSITEVRFLTFGGKKKKDAN